MADNQTKYMIERFLQWKLPESFNPDGGISFKKTFNENTSHPMKHEPVGTNLFDFTQAEEMVRYMIEGLPDPETVGEVVRTAPRQEWIDAINRELFNLREWANAEHARADRAERAPEEIVRIGRQMANVCYNVHQRLHALTDRDREVMGELYQEWDAALRKFRGCAISCSRASSEGGEVNSDNRIARLERLLLKLVRAQLGHGGMENAELEEIERELALPLPYPSQEPR